MHLNVRKKASKKERKIDRQTDRQTEREKERKKERKKAWCLVIMVSIMRTYLMPIITYL